MRGALLTHRTDLRLLAWSMLIALSTVTMVHPRLDPQPSTSGAPAERASLSQRIEDAYGKLPLSFEPNVGQAAAPVDFLARGAGYALFLSQGDAVLALRATEPARASAGWTGSRGPDEAGATRLRGLRMHLVDAGVARPMAEAVLPGAINYFVGNDPSRWR